MNRITAVASWSNDTSIPLALGPYYQGAIGLGGQLKPSPDGNSSEGVAQLCLQLDVARRSCARLNVQAKNVVFYTQSADVIEQRRRPNGDEKRLKQRQCKICVLSSTKIDLFLQILMLYLESIYIVLFAQ